MYIYHLISIDLQLSRLLNSPTLALLHKILNKEGNLYKVKLPDLIKVYPIFLLDKLWKAINNLLPR